MIILKNHDASTDIKTNWVRTENENKIMSLIQITFDNCTGNLINPGQIIVQGTNSPNLTDSLTSTITLKTTLINTISNLTNSDYLTISNIVKYVRIKYTHNGVNAGTIDINSNYIKKLLK